MYRKRLSSLVQVVAALAVVNGAGLSATPQAADAQGLRLAPGGQITVRNSSGSVSITGWDEETMRASATKGGGEELVGVGVAEDAARSGGLLITPPPFANANTEPVQLHIKVPRHAVIKSVVTDGGDVTVTGVEGAVNVTTGSGDVKVHAVTGALNIATENGDVEAEEVGAVNVETRRGTVRLRGVKGVATVKSGGSLSARNVEGDLIARVTSGGAEAGDVGGLVDLTVADGGARVRNAKSDVRVVSIRGGVEVRCAKGRVEVSNVNGSITLAGIGGDAEATTTGGQIRYVGEVHAGRHYRLKSHAASIEMAIPPGTSGFTATVSSFQSRVETDFPLQDVTTAPGGSPPRRLIARYGDGGAQITLDSFRGTVRLLKSAPGASDGCAR